MVDNMAKTVSVVITDDLDNTPGAEAVSFGLNGQSYEIDLAPANREKMATSLQPFIEAGRRTSLRKPARTRQSREDLASVRAWAAAQGLNVAERGRVSAEVLNKYDAAH
jgi:hypothetical protein